MVSAHQTLPKRRPLHPVASVVSGAIAACTAVLITNIPETIKIRLQLDGEGLKAGSTRQFNGVWDAFAKTWRHEGIRGLQAGLSAAIVYQFFLNGFRLGLFDPIRRTLRRVQPTGYNQLVDVIAGAASGAVGATLGSPLYLVKTRLQAQSPIFAAREQHAYKSVMHGLQSIYRTEGGVRGLFRGLDGALPRVMVGSSTQLMTYEWVKSAWSARWSPTGQPDMTTHMVAALASSLATVTLMNPFDVVSTRLYQSSGKGTVYHGPIDCAVQTVRNEGWRALMKGWTPQYIRLGPHTILTFLILEQLRPWMQQYDSLLIAAVEDTS